MFEHRIQVCLVRWSRLFVVWTAHEQREEMGAAARFFQQESIIKVLQKIVPTNVDDDRELGTRKGEIGKVLLGAYAQVNTSRGASRKRFGYVKI